MRTSTRRRRSRLALTGLAAVLLATSTGLTAAAAAAPRPRPADPLQEQVDAIHATGVVGVQAEVTTPGTRDTARAGTAASGTGRPMPQDGRYRIGSLTKTFTAAVVLQLAEEGRLSLDDTVEQWLPGLVRGNGNDGRHISLRQLLQHTSGLPEVVQDVAALNSADGYRAERFRSYTPEELVASALERTNTGTDWSYSNTNYLLAAMIIEEATGRTWEREVTDRIIRPLGLADTSAPGAFPFVLGRHAQSYTAFGGDTAVDVTTLNPSMAIGAGALISSTRDVNEFYAALLDGRLLEPAQIAELTATVPAPDLGGDYGLGLAEIPLSCGGTYFAHVGELLGYRTWAGVTADGSRAASVYVTSDGGPDTQGAMATLVDQELCRTAP